MFAMISVGTGTQINTRYSSGPSGSTWFFRLI